MHLTLLTAGSRGDIQPFIALGKGLAAAGHEVKIATHETFDPLIRQAGLDFAPLPGDPRSMVHSGVGRKMMDSGGNGLEYVLNLARLVAPQIDRYLADAEAACQGAEGIVCSHLMFVGCDIAEKLRVPSCIIALLPFGATRDFPMILAPEIPLLGGAYNLMSQTAPASLISSLLAGPLNRWRQSKLGLPPLPGGPLNRHRQETLPIYYAYSPSVLPRPADWPANQQVTGYLFLDGVSAWTPPPELLAFIENGPPPVYVGFGSMTTAHPESETKTILDALARANARAVLATGWGGLGQGDLGPDVFAITDAPHDWLFPRMAAVVHHGGAGTTAAGLRAGVPAVVVPFNADQPFWGRQIAKLGVGPQPIPKERLAPGTLAAAIRQATGDGQMKARAADLGRRIRAEDGAAETVRAIEAAFQMPRSSRLVNAEVT
jgi:UDP:flavonoid glycosyltransferase YjiC (YdhE family)